MIEDKIKEIREHLTDTDDIAVLTDWDMVCSAEFAFIATELAKVKRDRATRELALKSEILASQGKYTEKEIERQYFASEEGKYYQYGSEMLKALAKLISAVRFKRKMLTDKF